MIDTKAISLAEPALGRRVKIKNCGVVDVHVGYEHKKLGTVTLDIIKPGKKKPFSTENKLKVWTLTGEADIQVLEY